MNKLKNCSIKCDKKFIKQCVSQHNTNACKIRFFNGRCLMALKLKEKEISK